MTDQTVRDQMAFKMPSPPVVARWLMEKDGRLVWVPRPALSPRKGGDNE